jgi:hypothetical protein
VRLITDVTLEEFRSWFQVEHVVLVECDRELQGCDIELASDDAEVFAPIVAEALAKEGLAASLATPTSTPIWPRVSSLI